MKKQNYLRSRRLRVFGGPNGSGKSTILEQINSKYDLGYYINADDIERQLKSEKEIELAKYGIYDLTAKQFNSYLKNHTLVHKARGDGYLIDLELDKNTILNPDNKSHSYEAAFLADIIRQEVLKLGRKFAYETVMSHKSKVGFFEKTYMAGYKNYLYYISTESPLINIERVKQRVQLGGHAVSKNKIESRYYKSLENLKSAIELTYRTFVFDNSGAKPILILEVLKGSDVTFYPNEIPHWVDKYLLE